MITTSFGTNVIVGLSPLKIDAPFLMYKLLNDRLRKKAVKADTLYLLQKSCKLQGDVYCFVEKGNDLTSISITFFCVLNLYIFLPNGRVETRLFHISWTNVVILLTHCVLSRLIKPLAFHITTCASFEFT